MNIIIADTSCLILFTKIQKIEILRDLFQEIQVTPEVALEFGNLPEWIKVTNFSNLDRFKNLESILGKGEASAITLALELEDSLLLIDEKKGRKIAKEYGIQIIGSLGVVLLAKQHGKINSVTEILNLILDTNFRISQAIIKLIIKDSGEQ